jgi:hypothetical protein
VFLLYISNVLLGRLTLLIKDLYDLSKNCQWVDDAFHFVEIHLVGKRWARGTCVKTGGRVTKQDE